MAALNHFTQEARIELRISDKLRRAVYRKSCKLVKEGWQKKGEIKKISINDSFNKKYYVYAQDLIKM